VVLLYDVRHVILSEYHFLSYSGIIPIIIIIMTIAESWDGHGPPPIARTVIMADVWSYLYTLMACHLVSAQQHQQHQHY
jgi:hypothetical protein